MKGTEILSAMHHKNLTPPVGIDIVIIVMHRYIHVERCLLLRRKE